MHTRSFQLVLAVFCWAGAEAHVSVPQVRARTFVRARAHVFAKEPEFLYETDEIEPPQKKKAKPPVSAAMRQRLLKENRALGGDPGASSGNPILILSGVIAILAILVLGGGMA